MRAGLAPGLARIGQAALPGLVCLAAVIAMAAPSPIPPSAMPDLVLMLVYLAAAFRAAAFPVWLCFLFGLLSDLLGSTPVGMQAAVFLATHAFAASQRRHLDLALLLWGGFAIVAAAAGLFRWGLISAYHGLWLDAEPILLNVAVTAALFPFVAEPLRRAIGGGSRAVEYP
jgi:rod shape-determining protein MreD